MPGRFAEIVGEMLGQEADGRRLARPVRGNLSHPLEMDPRDVQRSLVIEEAPSPHENAHGDLVGRAEEDDGNHFKSGKWAQHLGPERPDERESRVLETGDGARLDKDPDQFLAAIEPSGARQIPSGQRPSRTRNCRIASGERGISQVKPKT